MQLNLSYVSGATLAIIVINSLIFGAGYILKSQNEIIFNYGFIPDQLFKENSHKLTDIITRLFSSMFIHANLTHLIFNMISLIYLGAFAERSVGIPRYLTIYIVAGISGALLHGIVASYILGNGSSILVGASGAISGVLGIAAALGNVRGYYWLAIQILFAGLGTFTSISIAFLAHVGGFLAGLLLTKLMIVAEQRRVRAWDA